MAYGYGVAADAVGNALVTGSFSGTAVFGTSPASVTIVSAGGHDAFVAKFGTTAGTCAWAVRAGGSGEDRGSGVAVSAGGHAAFTGFFENTADFGSLTLMGSSTRTVSTGFLAVLGGAGTLPTRTPALQPPFTLAPNPARSTCQVQGAIAGADVTVLDALGRSLTHALADASGTARLELPDGLAPGLYLVRSGEQVRRLVVE